jgi:hypothetical protein
MRDAVIGILSTYTESEAEYSDGIKSAEQDLRCLQSRGETQDEFLRFAAEFRSMDMATPDQKRRGQTFLFEGGLSYSAKTKSLNPTKSSLFSCLDALIGQNQVWRPRRDLNPCYGRERALIDGKLLIPEDADGSQTPSRQS